MRAIWVTRGDYRTPADVNAIVQNSADAGFNAILFQVRGNGTVFYRSEIEPWAEELMRGAAGDDPGWDPLQTAIDAARAAGVELHAWINVMPAWRGTKPPSNPKQLYNAHPDWFWYDQNGKRQELTSFYVSLNPCLPEVRQYLTEVSREVATKYDIDGLHLDYIRFPNEPPATPRGSGIDYPRDAKTLELYAAATGKKPDDDKAAWNAWRTEQVNTLVSDIRGALRESRPRAVLTAAVGAKRANGLTHFQDGYAWLDRGSVDAVILMNYTPDIETFSARLEPWLTDRPKARVVPGLWFARKKGADEAERIAEVAQEIQHSREKTGDFCVFSYSALFDSTDQELNPQTEETRKLRAMRREKLIPVIRG